MQFHNITQKTKIHREKRIGRGGKRGTYSGRGIKGMGARAGAKYRPAERDILKRIPKLRGYKFKSFHEKPAVINVDMLEKKFKEGDTVSPATVLKAGLVRRIKGKTPQVKILGRGKLNKKFVFKDVAFSRVVAEKINPPPSQK